MKKRRKGPWAGDEMGKKNEERRKEEKNKGAMGG